MNKAQAQRMWDSLNSAQKAVYAAIAGIRVSVSQEAGDLCDYYLTDVSVRLWLHLLSPLMQEHPELKASGLPEGDPHWRPLRIPSSELKKVMSALADLRAVLQSTFPIVDKGAATPGESIGYRTALVSIGDAVQEATTQIDGLSADSP